MPEFEYYDLENWIFSYYYPYMTIGAQGGASLLGMASKHHIPQQCNSTAVYKTRKVVG